MADLEIALNGMPGKREIHASLAKAYRRTGGRTRWRDARGPGDEVGLPNATRGDKCDLVRR